VTGGAAGWVAGALPALASGAGAPAQPPPDGKPIGDLLSSNSMVWAIGFMLFAIVALRVLGRRSKGGAAVAAGRRGRESADPSEPAGVPGKVRSGQDPEIAKLYIELNEFAREMEGRLDTKIAYLRRLIVDAESVMRDLNRAIEGGERLKRGEPAGEAEPAPPPAAPESGPEPQGRFAAEPPPPLVDVLVGGSDGLPAQPFPAEGVQGRILSLWSAGKPQEAISEEVGVPRGEVELVLSLHRASQKKAKARKE
jgi:hypothetical protein